MATNETVGEVILNGVRLSFAKLFDVGKPRKNKEGELIESQYGCAFLIPKDASGKANLAKIKAAADEVKAEKWGKKEKWPKLKPEKVCLRDGDLEDYDGYAGMWYLSANNKNQPVLVDRKKDAKGKLHILTKENGGPKLLYSGAYVNAVVRLWVQDNEHGKRLNASVESVQFLKHGEAFSGNKPVDPNEKFEDIEDDEDDDADIRGVADDEDDDGI